MSIKETIKNLMMKDFGGDSILRKEDTSTTTSETQQKVESLLKSKSTFQGSISESTSLPMPKSLGKQLAEYLQQRKDSGMPLAPFSLGAAKEMTHGEIAREFIKDWEAKKLVLSGYPLMQKVSFSQRSARRMFYRALKNTVIGKAVEVKILKIVFIEWNEAASTYLHLVKKYKDDDGSPFLKGLFSFQAGLAETKNPYSEGTWEDTCWFSGYHFARRESGKAPEPDDDNVYTEEAWIWEEDDVIGD